MPSVASPSHERLRPFNVIPHVRVHGKRTTTPQSLYVGIELEASACQATNAIVTTGCKACVYIHDGICGVEYFIDKVDKDSVYDKVKGFLTLYASQANAKIHAAGLGFSRHHICVEGACPQGLLNDIQHTHQKDPHARINHTQWPNPESKLKLEAAVVWQSRSSLSYKDLRTLATQLWLDLDIVPFLVETKGSTLEERACSAARKCIMHFACTGGPNLVRLDIGYQHRVEVDCNGKIYLVGLDDYQKTCSSFVWNKLLRLSSELKQKQVSISFFNSTPQGGGVALMKHALMRILRLLNVKANWFVAKPRPDVFEITKRKFHNVLQGVAPVGTHLTAQDKEVYEEWIQSNLDMYWSDSRGPLATSDIIVVDDPQPSGMIPFVKKLHPSCKVIYRSHIELRGDLIGDESTEQAAVWRYLWDNIKDADAFISHPIKHFIPECVPSERTFLMPASTDPLDGLNKELAPEYMDYYRQLFNRVASDQSGKRADFWNRPYIVQICRFDPSKGIPDAIKAYAALRKKVNAILPFIRIPQLIIAGHGSIDDPDGKVVYERTMQFIEDEDENGLFGITSDVIVVRCPPCDQMLNVLLRGAILALQLSVREGFEIKVTEAVHKGVPIIAYASGGIPHQIDHGETGYLVPTGDYLQVADYMYALLMNDDLRKRLSDQGRAKNLQELYTVFQTVNWLALFKHVMDPSEPLVIGSKSRHHPESTLRLQDAPWRWARDLWLSE